MHPEYMRTLRCRTRDWLRVLAVTTCLAVGTVACSGTSAGSQRERQNFETAEAALEACRTTPVRFRGNCSAERANYDEALRRYKATGEQ